MTTVAETELAYPGPLKRGDRGVAVMRLQEWLGLRQILVQIDADFGPATEAALAHWQLAASLPQTGTLDELTWKRLTAPMRDALASGPLPSSLSLGGMTLIWARRMLIAHAREIGGDNRGPWVRLFMGGRDGPSWRWCAGFVCWCMERAAASLATTPPVASSFDCDTLAVRARRAGILLELPEPADRAGIQPGSLFVLRGRMPGPDGGPDWIHTGIVEAIGGESFASIEGNTNDDGSPNGYGVFARHRPFGRADFIVLP